MHVHKAWDFHKLFNVLDCPPGAPVAMCSGDPCDLASCPAHPSARCVPNFCGGCNAVFYDRKGKKVLCAGNF